MTCRCATNAEHQARADAASYAAEQSMKEADRKKVAALENQIAAMTPDPTKYEILDAIPAGSHLVVKVRFPSCSKCAYEGIKVLVYLNVSPVDALKWRKLDPHFRAGKTDAFSAPSPDARFPASTQGWADAIAWAKDKYARICAGT